MNWMDWTTHSSCILSVSVCMFAQAKGRWVGLGPAPVWREDSRCHARARQGHLAGSWQRLAITIQARHQFPVVGLDLADRLPPSWPEVLAQRRLSGQ